MGNSMGEEFLIYISRHDILILNETLAMEKKEVSPYGGEERWYS